MREVGAVHRDLYAEHAELYGENIAPKIERCLAIGEGEAAAAAALSRGLPGGDARGDRAVRAPARPDARVRRARSRRRRARRAGRRSCASPSRSMPSVGRRSRCRAVRRKRGCKPRSRSSAGRARMGSCSAPDWRSRRRWAATTAGPSRRAMTEKARRARRSVYSGTHLPPLMPSRLSGNV